MSKYSLFGVNINPETTYDGKNILKVSSKKEIFYDIFECSFNGKKIIVEKIDELENKPLVEFKLKKDGKVFNCKALLEVGHEENLILKESESAKKLRIASEEKKLREKAIIKEMKKVLQEEKLKKKILEEKENKRIELVAEEIKKELEEKIKLEKEQRIKKQNEEVLLEENLEEEKESAKPIVESPFYNYKNIYKLDIDLRYRKIKIINESTGAEKIFQTNYTPRRVILNKNLLSYENIVNEDSILNYTIDIETEEVVNKKYIEPEDMGGTDSPKISAASDDQGIGNIVSSKTKINIFFDNSGSMDSTLSPLQTMATENLKDSLLPFYDNNESAYDDNVNVLNFNAVPALSTFNMSPVENSIVLGGVNMREISSDFNVINMMFQDETNSHPLSRFTGTSTEGLKKSSVHFLTGGLEVNNKHRSIFFHVDSDFGGESDYRTLLIDLSGALQDTTFKDQTTFTLDVVDGDTPENYATVIVDALNNVSTVIN